MALFKCPDETGLKFCFQIMWKSKIRLPEQKLDKNRYVSFFRDTLYKCKYKASHFEAVVPKTTNTRRVFEHSPTGRMYRGLSNWQTLLLKHVMLDDILCIKRYKIIAKNIVLMAKLIQMNVTFWHIQKWFCGHSVQFFMSFLCMENISAAFSSTFAC